MNPWGAEVSPLTEGEFFNDLTPTTLLLVEGASDEYFWAARVDRRCCVVRAVGGREKALAELGKAQAEGKAGFVALLDADFDRVDGTLRALPHVVWTDLHDLEAILIASPALDKVLAELGSREKLKKIERDEGCGVREALLARAADLAALRWISRRDNLKLTFRKLSREGFKYVEYQAFCDRASWRVDREKLVRKVLDFSSRHELDVADLVARMKTIPSFEPWQLCVGHDVMGLLVVGLRSKLGSNQHMNIDELQQRFRLAFEFEHLQRTAMFRGLRAWEEDNRPYRVFSK